jgi:hypothetical protein
MGVIEGSNFMLGWHLALFIVKRKLPVGVIFVVFLIGLVEIVGSAMIIYKQEIQVYISGQYYVLKGHLVGFAGLGLFGSGVTLVVGALFSSLNSNILIASVIVAFLATFLSGVFVVIFGEKN